MPFGKPDVYLMPRRLEDGTLSRAGSILVKERKDGKTVYRLATDEEEREYREDTAW